MAITIRSSCISVPLFRAADVVGVEVPAVRGAVGQPACHRNGHGAAGSFLGKLRGLDSAPKPRHVLSFLVCEAVVSHVR